MSIRVVVGANWGDEGKGRMIDYFAKDADFVVRYQGGSNAGHTIVNDLGLFKLRLIPSGIFYKNVTNVIGPGVAVNLEMLHIEKESLLSKGISIDSTNLKISDRAIICFPFHILQDKYEEERLDKNKFGSTLQGIAPAYGDRYMKYSIQVGWLKYPSFLKGQLSKCLSYKNSIFQGVYNKPTVSLDEIFDWTMKYGKLLSPHVCDTVELLGNATKNGKTILLEAQLGTLRDVIYGIYPFTTSSNPIAGFAQGCAGIFNYHKAPEVTAVVKSFSTCVGEGPFVTEMMGEEAERLRTIAKEYGAATGRPRRVGNFDAVATRYGVAIQGATEIALTKLDCLSGNKTLKICTSYRVESRSIKNFPLMPELILSKPEYVEMPGWSEDITQIRQYSDLPLATREYIEAIESYLEAPVKYVSVGPERNSMILKS